VHRPTEPHVAKAPKRHLIHTALFKEYPSGHLQSVIADEFDSDTDNKGHEVLVADPIGQYVLFGHCTDVSFWQKLPAAHWLHFHPPGEYATPQSLNQPPPQMQSCTDAEPGGEKEFSGQALQMFDPSKYMFLSQFVHETPDGTLPAALVFICKATLPLNPLA
jgi:hypothetical protein